MTNTAQKIGYRMDVSRIRPGSTSPQHITPTTADKTRMLLVRDRLKTAAQRGILSSVKYPTRKLNATIFSGLTKTEGAVMRRLHQKTR